MQPSDDEEEEPPMAVALGFLGAGKTTLVHHILNASHKYRIAVIVNEFGDTSGIEKAAVTSGQGDVVVPAEEWVELANGCLCCSVKSDFVAALEGLMLKRDKFDYILIETTGLADPGPVAAALWTDDELEAAVHLDAIVTVVDAKNIQRQLQEHHSSSDEVNEAQKQIAYADSVLLNKVDLLPSEEAICAVEDAIHAHNADVAIIRTSHCSLNVAQILNRNAFVGSSQPPSLLTLHDNMHLGPSHAPHDIQPVATSDGGGMQQSGAASVGHNAQLHNSHRSSEAASSDHQAANQQHGDHQEQSPDSSNGTHGHSHQHPMSHDHAGHAHQHDSSVRSISITCPGEMDMIRLKDWLDTLLWEKGTATQDIYRMKGLIRVIGSEKAQVLQAVHELYDVVPGIAWSDLPAQQQDHNRLVVIGRNLDLEALQQGFMQSLAGQG
ncbi:MAG: hypothetical protein FRX49_10975 [Trebouxia sp. A1-2]|nr:MAG: hypothetical protein FRX49_10975 [Trebouxia sp. A1-2]